MTQKEIGKKYAEIQVRKYQATADRWRAKVAGDGESMSRADKILKEVKDEELRLQEDCRHPGPLANTSVSLRSCRRCPDCRKIFPPAASDDKGGG